MSFSWISWSRASWGRSWGVELVGLGRVLAAHLLKLLVELFALLLIFGIIDFGGTDFGHRCLVAEDVAAVGEGVSYDESEESHADHNDQKD